VVRELTTTDLDAYATAYRGAATDELALEAWRDLMRELSRRGHGASHALSTALATRVLRPGSSAESDSVLDAALTRWVQLEQALGVAIDQRSACAVISEDAGIAAALASAFPGVAADRAWVRGVLQGLLWSAPEEARTNALHAPMPFVDDAPATERTLVLEALARGGPSVDVDDPAWRAAADRALLTTGGCILRCSAGQESMLRDAVVELMAVPTETASLQLHPRVVRHRRGAGWSMLAVELAEAPQ
jgi:hypothetical protein